MEKAPNTSGVKECCKTVGNLEFKEKVNDLETYACKVCGCKHRRLKIDPANIGAIFKFIPRPKPTT